MGKFQAVEPLSIIQLGCVITILQDSTCINQFNHAGVKFDDYIFASINEGKTDISE